jgi:hypothetical protein
MNSSIDSFFINWRISDNFNIIIEDDKFNDNILEYFLNLTFVEQSKSAGYHIYFNFNNDDIFIKE